MRLGPTYTHTRFQTSLVENNRAAPGLAVAIQVSPHISVQTEYAHTKVHLTPPPGATSDDVLRNVIPRYTNIAGVSRGLESRQIRYAYSQLVGVNPSPWGRLRLEVLGGLGVQAQEERSYFDAYVPVGAGTSDNPRRFVRMPGKYYVLEFQTPDSGIVAGVNAEIAVARGLTVIPMFRYSRMSDPGPSRVYAIGAHWRF